jgi:hypothetical protein
MFRISLCSRGLTGGEGPIWLGKRGLFPIAKKSIQAELTDCCIMMRLQKISDFGTATPAFARTFPQGCRLLDFFQRTPEEKEEAKKLLLELQRHALKCVEIRDQLAKEIAVCRGEVEKNGFTYQSGGRVITLPGIGDLQSRAEMYLQSSKLAVAATGNLVRPFYGVGHNHKFHQFMRWAEKQFGQSDNMFLMVKHWEPVVKRLVKMRNAVDHPENRHGGELITYNFSIDESSTPPDLIDPAWGLTGEMPKPIINDFDNILEYLLLIGEDVMTELFYKFKPDFPLEVQEIPFAKRDPSNPQRLEVGLVGMAR